MRAKEAKLIPISEYLTREWHQALRSRVWWRELWYSSPLRAGDSNPSFKVDTELNLWFDHGLARWGDIIHLVRDLHNVTTSQALAILDGSGLVGSQPTISHTDTWLTQNWLVLPFDQDKKNPAVEKEKQAYFSITQVWPITSPALIQYLKSRKINLEIAQIYLKEIRFKPRNLLREYFALGFPNGNGLKHVASCLRGFWAQART